MGEKPVTVGLKHPLVFRRADLAEQLLQLRQAICQSSVEKLSSHPKN
jgi:hypothetical protein